MKKLNIKLVLLTVCFIVLLPCALSAEEPPIESWVARYNGPGNYIDEATDIAVDASGNVYVTGWSIESRPKRDYATIKYDRDGNEIWIKRYNSPGTGSAEARAIAVDATGNVYVTGYCFTGIGGTSDYDYITIKYDTNNGNELWVARYDGPGNQRDLATDIAIDSDYVYVTGWSYGSVTYDDYATVKYDKDSGEMLWEARWEAPYADRACAIAVDSDYVYVTGCYQGNPGTRWQNYATFKHNKDSGVKLWGKAYNGPPIYALDQPTGIAVDASGNVYVTGYSEGSGTWYDYATVKYDAAGTEQWVRRYCGPGRVQDIARAIGVDASGNVYVTGKINWGPPTSTDYTTVKYDTNGNELWVRRYNGPRSSIDQATAMVVDEAGNVYVTGWSSAYGTWYDYATIKYDTDGDELWVMRYNGPIQSDYATAMAVDAYGNVYVTGKSQGIGTDLDYATVKYSPANQAPVAAAGADQTAHPGISVTLDGSGSSDPDENYPLTYSWQIVSTPEGSTVELLDADKVNPSFEPDMLGSYIIELVVTDSLGAQSAADSVCISTENSPPVADAGEDQAIIEIGTIVQLDGTQSWDDDGDDITFAWTLVKPADSYATLSDPSSPTPYFEADVHGDYVAQLVVSDLWDASQPDSVTVSFMNVKPVADAGDNQSVVQGDTVNLDGSGSSDANLDPLTYSWSFVSTPEGSGAEIDDPTSALTSFVADLAGTYVVSLIVNDGFEDSDASNVTVVAIPLQDAVTQALQEAIETINGLDDYVFKNKNMKNALTNKINAAIGQVTQGLYQEALDKLEHDILGKTNGCAEAGAPDKNDWIKDCEAQNQVYPIIVYAIDLLGNLI